MRLESVLSVILFKKYELTMTLPRMFFRGIKNTFLYDRLKVITLLFYYLGNSNS